MPDDMPNMVGSSVKDFVSSLFEGVKAGLEQQGMEICKEADSHSKLELNAVATNETSGKGGAKILGLGGELGEANSNTNSQKVTIFVRRKPNFSISSV